MDRVTRYPILSIPHSSKVSDLPPDLESHYTFDIVQVESVSPDWVKDMDEMDAGGQHFRFSPEETSGMRMVTVTRETVPMPHLVKETQHVLTENYSANQWTPTWQRKSQVEVVKAGPTYTLRAYPEEQHPGKLYSGEEEEEEQQVYLLGPDENAFPKRRRDLEREREAVIQGQVVKRSTTVATQWSSQEELDKIYSGQEPSPILVSDSENAVDTEQINFLAARKQFLNLEKLTSNSQPPQKPMGRTTKSVRASPEAGQANVDQSTRSYWSSRVGLTNGYTLSIKAPGKDNAEEVPPELVLSDEGPKETPIEREIRQAQEREADLRQQRGLQRSGSRDELVEVPARPLLSNVNLIFTPASKKGKEVGRPSSLYIQREIALDTKREEDHRRQAGRSEPIIHANRASTPSQLAKDSELPTEAPKIRRVQSSDSILSLTSDTHPVKATVEGRKIRRIPLEAYQPYLTPDSTKKEFSSYSSYKQGSSLGSEGHTMGSRRKECVATPLLSSQKASWGAEQIREQPQKPLASSIPRQEPWRSPSQESTRKTWATREQGADDASQGVVPQNYFHLQPMKIKITSPGSEEVSISQQEHVWEPKGHVEEVTIPTKPPRSQSSNLLKMEIQSVLQREREREEECRERVATPLLSSQKASWGAEQIREQPQKSLASSIPRQEPWRSPSQESTRKTWATREQAADDASQGVVPWKYFHLQPMKIKINSPGSEEVSVSQQEHVWEPKGHVEEVAIPAKPPRSQSSNLLEMEIQSVLQREREREEERRNALFPEVFSPATELDQHFEWGDPDSRHSSVASGITGSYSVSETPTLSPVHFHSSLVWKVTDQKPRQEDVPWKPKREVGYAGLDTSDAVNTEIVEATKVTRHKNAMAARWEARIYASEDED